MLHDNRGPRCTEPRLTIEDALMAFDNWDPVARRGRGPAYGTVVSFNARRASLEKLTRDVLLDRGMDPERWQEHTATVLEAFGVWLTLDAPSTKPADPGPDREHAA